jgi:hypothetical protein
MVYLSDIAERSTNDQPYILDIEGFFTRECSTFAMVHMLIGLGLLAGLTILGRAPGFRKTEVRRVLQASIKKLD